MSERSVKAVKAHVSDRQLMGQLTPVVVLCTVGRRWGGINVCPVTELYAIVKAACRTLTLVKHWNLDTCPLSRHEISRRRDTHSYASVVRGGGGGLEGVETARERPPAELKKKPWATPSQQLQQLTV